MLSAGAQLLSRLGPQLGIEPALDDGEECLIVSRGGNLAPLGPADAAAHRFGHDVAFVRQADNVIKHHRHVAAELFLNRDSAFGSQVDQCTVDM